MAITVSRSRTAYLEPMERPYCISSFWPSLQAMQPLPGFRIVQAAEYSMNNKRKSQMPGFIKAKNPGALFVGSHIYPGMELVSLDQLT